MSKFNLNISLPASGKLSALSLAIIMALNHQAMAAVNCSQTGDTKTCSTSDDISINSGSAISVNNPDQKGIAHAIQNGGTIINSGSDSAILAGASFVPGGGLPPWLPPPPGSPKPEEVTTKAIVHQNAGRIIATALNSVGLKAITGGSSAGQAIIFQNKEASINTKRETIAVLANGGTHGKAVFTQKGKILSENNPAATVWLTAGEIAFDQSETGEIISTGKGEGLYTAAMRKSDNNIININGKIHSEKGSAVYVENSLMSTTLINIANGSEPQPDNVGKTIINIGKNAVVTTNADKTEARSDLKDFYVKSTKGFAIAQKCGLTCDSSFPPYLNEENFAANSDVTIEKGATIKGAIGLSDGVDHLTINGADISNIYFMDGGDDVSNDGVNTFLKDKSNNSPLKDNWTDTLTLNGVKNQYAGSDMTRWEIIQLAKETKLDLTDDLHTGHGKDSNNNNMGLHIDKTSTISPTTNLTITGDVYNSGIIDLDKHNHLPNDTLTIDGDYLGEEGATVRANLVWNKDDSQSDVLHIKGSASGVTKVVPVGKGGSQDNFIDGNIERVADIISKTRPIILVDKHNTLSFEGTAQTNSAGEIQLSSSSDGNGGRQYFWTAEVKSKEPILKSSVAGIVQMPTVNLEQGYASMATLHTRRGDNLPMAWDSCGCLGKKADTQTWARLYGKHLELEGKNRFNTNMDIYGLQFGHDFDVHYNPDSDSRYHTGIFATLSNSNADFYDRFRAKNGIITDDKYTGSGQAQNISLALEHTRYAKNGAYLDLVGQVSYLRNQYQPINASKVNQRGFGLGGSIEMGRPYEIGESAPKEAKWVIEPQAQLNYQYLDLGAFKVDQYTTVDSGNHHGVRGRIGARLSHYSYNNTFTNTFYFKGNVYHDFTTTGKIDIGDDQLKEKYNNTWGEVGVGVDIPLSKHSRIYGDMLYEHNINGEKLEGYHGSVGFKYTW